MAAAGTSTSLHTARRRRLRRSRAPVYILLVLGGLVVAYPFFYMVMNSVKPGPEILNAPNNLPTRIVFDGYAGVFQTLNMGRLYLNSIILAGSITILNTLFSALAAYAIAKIPFPGRSQLFAVMLATMMIPSVLFLIPTYVIMYRLGWVGHFQALIIPSAVSVYNIFLLRQFMLGLPGETIEAARIDGADDLRVFFSVILPLARPALVTVAVLSFMGSWNDFLGPLLYLNNPSTWTVQLGLYQFNSSIPGEHAQEIWAATTLITLPLVLLYFLLQDQFMQAFANVSFK
ncbi:MAG TPA: carbohydrate ABC transporter permease [Anaerolineae bacterium]